MATVVFQLGSDGVPSNQTSPVGGAPTTTIDPSGTVDNTVFPPEIVSSITDVAYYGIEYVTLTSANVLAQARVFNRAAAILNSTSGICSANSTSATDTGTLIITGQVGGAWKQDKIVLTGTTTSYGSMNFDANSVYRWEYSNGSGSSAKPLGNISCFINAAQVCLFYGTGNGTSNNAVNNACSMCSAEISLALATAKNTPITCSNILTAPATGSVVASSQATVWTNADASITVPTTGAMVQNDYVGVLVTWLVKANIPLPLTGKVQQIVSLLAVQTS